MPGSPDFLWLLSNEEILQLMLFACPEGVIVLDRNGRLILYTGASEQIFGFAPIEVLDHPATSVFLAGDEWEGFSGALASGGSVTNVEMQAHRKDGGPFWVAVSASVLRDRYGDTIGTVLYVRDQSQVRGIESALRDKNRQLNDLVEELDFLARHDHLTGLLNRASAIEAAQSAVVSCGLNGRPFAVAVFDLDHFKSVNDTYGHFVGDEVLRAVAQVLRQAARAGDVIGRFGGEEFIALFPAANLEQATSVAERVRVLIAQAEVPLGDGMGIRVTVSAGVAAIPSCADNLREAIRVADDRLFIAKRQGRNQVVFSDRQPDHQTERHAA